jgi:hypothetical protein
MGVKNIIEQPAEAGLGYQRGRFSPACVAAGESEGYLGKSRLRRQIVECSRNLFTPASFCSTISIVPNTTHITCTDPSTAQRKPLAAM